MKKNTGITLIALVITIIVLLILAGVSINMITGNNGILNKAQNATDATILAQYQEKLDLIAINQNMNYNSSDSLSDRVISQLNGESEKDWVKDANKIDGSNYICVHTLDNYTIVAIVENDTVKIASINKNNEKSSTGGNNVTLTAIVENNCINVSLQPNESRTAIYNVYNSDNSICQTEIIEGATAKIYIDNTFGKNQSFYVKLKDLSGNESSSSNTININNEYNIYTATDLKTFRDNVNSGTSYKGKTINLKNDIDLKCDNTHLWTEIGNSETNAFLGSFDGNNNSIKGIYGNIALFGKIGNSTCSDIKLSNLKTYGEIVGKNSNRIAGIVATSYTILIDNCENYVDITVDTENIDTVGGICASSTLNYDEIGISNCKNYGNITTKSTNSTGANRVGGICGEPLYGIVERCVNYGNIMAENSTVGGICGMTSAGCIINYAGNEGTIKGNYAGGILGYNASGGIGTNCYNKGDITGKYSSTGIGYGTANNVENCYNTGVIKADIYAAGIVVNGQMSNCYNIGNISSNVYLGALSAMTGSNVTNSFYLKDSCIKQKESAKLCTVGEEKSNEEMKEITQMLGNEYTQDVNNINDGYPVLKWQIQ